MAYNDWLISDFATKYYNLIMKYLSLNKLHKDGDSGGLPPESPKNLLRNSRQSKALLACMISSVFLMIDSPFKGVNATLILNQFMGGMVLPDPFDVNADSTLEITDLSITSGGQYEAGDCFEIEM